MAEMNGKSGTGCFNWMGWFLGLNMIWLLLGVLAIFLGYRSYNLSVNGEVATGIVVRYVEDDTSASFTDIYPVVEFQVNDQSYSVRSQNNYRWWNQYTRFPIGKQVEIRYEPSNPEKAEINSWIDLWGEPLLLGIFTIIAAIVTNSFLVFRWRAARISTT